MQKQVGFQAKGLMAAGGLALIAGLAGQAVAQDSPPTPAAAKEELGAAEIVVVGEGARRLSTPGSSAVITEEDLVRTRAFTVNDALRQAPGLYPRDEEGLGLRPNIGVRGLSPTRSSKVLQLEDGVPLAYAPYGDNASYSHPPFRRFVRIETLKGASQIRFGPNTVGGVINYITPKAPDDFEGAIFAAGGARGYGEVDAKAGGPLIGGLNWIAHANATTFNGVRDNNDLNTDDLWLKIEGDLAPSHTIALRFGRASEDSQVTYSGLTTAEFNANPRQNPFANDRFTLERVTGAATHGWRMNDALTLTTTAYGLWFDRDWWRQSSNSGQRPNDASDPTCGGLANLLTTCGNEGRLREYNTYGVETRLLWDGELFGAKSEIEAGLRRHWERQIRLQVNGDSPRARTAGTSVNGGLRENNLRYANAWAGHLAARMEFGALTLSPGVRFESVDYERVNRLTGARGETDLQETIPGVGFSYALTPTAFLYGGVHRGFAPPRVEDVVTNAGGVVDLAPEESTNIELGLRGEPLKGVTADVALFRMAFDNQIVPASVAGGVGASLTNGGETRHQGLEASLRGSLKDMGRMTTDDVFFRAALTYLGEAKFVGRRTSNITGFTTVSVSGNRLPYAPEWIASAALGYAWGERADMQLEVQYTGDQYTDDLNTRAPTADGQRGLIPAATILNVTANVQPFEKGPRLFVTVKNLADELVIVDRSRGALPGAPRMVQVGFSQSF
jgi:Fe(3+) dicitrate transport protein